jgi:hypothetical protein
MAHGNLTKIHWFHSLPFQQFQALLTLFSKSFSPFPHGTCLLSVSNLYLALDEIYHPLCAPIPRNVTLRRNTVHGGLQMTNGTLTLVDALFQEAYICASIGGTISRLQFKARGPNFHAELFPVHSPLLRESYLVSFPPLTYMLKFSGFSDLTSCLGLGPRRDSKGDSPSARQKITSRMRFKLPVDIATSHALNASRAKRSPTP